MIGGISGQLSALAVETRSLRANAAEAEVENAHEKHDEAVAAAKEAARKAAEAAEDGGFWDDVASVAGDVALAAGCVAAVAATGGGAAGIVVIAAASMKLGGRALEEAGVASELTGGMQLVGGLGMAAGGVFAGAALAPALVQGANVVGGGATVAQGVSMGVSAKHEKDALDHQADQTASMGRATLADVDAQQSLGDMRQAVEDDLALEKAAREIEQQIQQHKTRMISQIGGA